MVLLDLHMPVMDGFELIGLLKQNEATKDIPIIVMSADNETETVSGCLKNGAIDYLIKPVRASKVKDLAHTIKKQGVMKPKSVSLNLNDYEILEQLGVGASGTVNKVRLTQTNQIFALKQIPITKNNEEACRMAENEVALLKVLTGPTVIKYYENFTEGDNLYIAMEYAEGGSIYDKIKECKKNNGHLETAQIKAWFSQMVLAILFMHCKNILHRDIKIQNIFLDENNIVKMGDFGIAKALATSCDNA